MKCIVNVHLCIMDPTVKKALHVLESEVERILESEEDDSRRKGVREEADSILQKVMSVLLSEREQVRASMRRSGNSYDKRVYRRSLKTMLKRNVNRTYGSMFSSSSIFREHNVKDEEDIVDVKDKEDADDVKDKEDAVDVKDLTKMRCIHFSPATLLGQPTYIMECSCDLESIYPSIPCKDTVDTDTA